MKLFEGNKVRPEVKKKLTKKFPSLTDEDFEEKNSDKLLIHLEQKLGKSKDDLRKILRDV